MVVKNMAHGNKRPSSNPGYRSSPALCAASAPSLGWNRPDLDSVSAANQCCRPAIRPLGAVWHLYLTTIDNGVWRPAAFVPHSSGRNEAAFRAAAAPSGVWLTWATDTRDLWAHWQSLLAHDVAVRDIRSPSLGACRLGWLILSDNDTGGQPQLVHPNERDDVRRVRRYRTTVVAPNIASWEAIFTATHSGACGNFLPSAEGSNGTKVLRFCFRGWPWKATTMYHRAVSLHCLLVLLGRSPFVRSGSTECECSVQTVEHVAVFRLDLVVVRCGFLGGAVRCMHLPGQLLNPGGG